MQEFFRVPYLMTLECLAASLKSKDLRSTRQYSALVHAHAAALRSVFKDSHGTCLSR